MTKGLSDDDAVVFWYDAWKVAETNGLTDARQFADCYIDHIANADKCLLDGQAVYLAPSAEEFLAGFELHTWRDASAEPDEGIEEALAEWGVAFALEVSCAERKRHERSDQQHPFIQKVPNRVAGPIARFAYDNN